MSISNEAVPHPDTSVIEPPLSLPSSSPRIAMNDPEFEKLTTAEKLNDPDYRELVYETYPDEPTCACCPSANLSTNSPEDVSEASRNFLVCKSGCKQSCCSSVRRSGVAFSHPDNANKDDKLPPFVPTYCVGNRRDNGCVKLDEDGRQKVDNGSYCDGVNRLRGGGEGGEREGEDGMYPQSVRVDEATVRRFDDAWNGTNCRVVNRRLEGGGGVGYEYVERHPISRSPDSATRTQCYTGEKLARGYPRDTYTEQPQDSHHGAIHHRRSPNACAPSSAPHEIVAAGCCCPGKENLLRSVRQRGNTGLCRKSKPCAGVDCLIKAFRETQEFVDSLGKVPGLVGLGLMDPSDSPYFGRDKQKEAHIEATKTAALAGTPALPNPQCSGPCNPQMLKSSAGGIGESYGETTPYAIAVPGRGGVVREAIPAWPGPGLTYPPGRSRKRDDRDKLRELEANSPETAGIESGPCGEPGCKAKRRPNEIPQPEATDEAADLPTKKLAPTANNGGRNSRTGSKQRGSLKTRPGKKSSMPPGGDRMGRKRSSGRSARRSIRFVYSAGDSYSGPTCGHKNCIEERHRVPGNMGWLWNLNETIGRLKPRPGWRPGAIARHVSEILREAKRLDRRRARLKSRRRSTSSSRSRSRSAPSRSGQRNRVRKDRSLIKKSPGRRKDDEEEEEIEPPPTLHIHRKDGTYYVTMYPIKQDKMDIPKLEEPMKPLQFKIAKNKDDASAASSSTASDMEIEFSPPAAVNRYHKKPNVVHVETQVKQQEILDAYKINDGKKSEKKKGKKGKK